MTENSETPVRPYRDDQSAGDIWFYTNTYRFYHEGLQKLLAQLKQLESVKDLFNLDESPLQREINHIERMVTWGDEKLADQNNTWGEISPRPSWGSLRLLKAGGLLQIREFEKKKELYLQKHTAVPKKIVQAIDEKLAQMKNLVELGAMNGLEPADVFLELDTLADSQAVPNEHATTPEIHHSTSTILVESDEMPIIDEQLRSRCLTTLRTIEAEKDDDKLDTVVREMSVILEDRVRTVANISEKLIGVDLMSSAFAGNSPKLIFSTDPDIQNAAHLLFRGYVGFFRNEVMHKLVTTFSRERVFQLLGYIDYLLFLLSRAQRSQPPPQANCT
jgi:hypothetical protein